MTEAGNDDRDEFEEVGFIPAPHGWWVLVRDKGETIARAIRPLAGWITTVEYGEHRFNSPAVQSDHVSFVVPCEREFGEDGDIEWIVVRTEELNEQEADLMGTFGRSWQSGT